MMGRTASIFVGGLISIGIVTALVLPGRQTIGATKAAADGGSKLLGTAITGK